MDSLLEPGVVAALRARRDHLHYYLRTWEFLRRNVGHALGRRVFPTLIQIGTQNRCNGSCVMCPYPHTVGRQPRQEMETALLESILDEIAAWPTGGMLAFSLQNEPLLDPRLPDFVASAHAKLKRRWRVEVTTNGTLLQGELARRLAGAAPHVLNVSIHGHSRKTYGEVMPGFDLDVVRGNLDAFLAMKSRETCVIVRYVKQQANDAEYRALRNHWVGRGVAVVGYEANDRLGDVKDFDSVRSHSAGWLRTLARRWLGRRAFRYCPFLVSQANILPDGRVLMCCHDYRHLDIMGDLNTVSLAEIFNSERYRNIRSHAACGEYAGVCARCSLFRTQTWL